MCYGAHNCYDSGALECIWTDSYNDSYTVWRTWYSYFTTAILLIASKRITLKERLLIKDAYNLNSLNGLVKLTKKILKGTVICELCGALLYSFVFVKDYGAWGIFYSIFNAVSAFCNAGMDLLGNNSLGIYRDNFIVNTVTMLLIILGGLGFL